MIWSFDLRLEDPTIARALWYRCATVSGNLIEKKRIFIRLKKRIFILLKNANPSATALRFTFPANIHFVPHSQDTVWATNISTIWFRHFSSRGTLPIDCWRYFPFSPPLFGCLESWNKGFLYHYSYICFSSIMERNEILLALCFKLFPTAESKLIQSLPHVLLSHFLSKMFLELIHILDSNVSLNFCGLCYFLHDSLHPSMFGCWENITLQINIWDICVWCMVCINSCVI